MVGVAGEDMLQEEQIEGEIVDQENDGDEMIALRFSKLA
jgi:hypothetical protein